jgi:hypothetical protein
VSFFQEWRSSLFRRSGGGPYAEAWHDFAWRVIAPLLWFAAFLVLPYPSVLLLRIGVPVPVLMAVFIFIMAAVAVSYWRLCFFRCPRCGHLFRRLWEWYPRHCRHCGLKKLGEVG